MKIWVDADACPVAMREILFRAAQRKSIVTTLVANQYLRIPTSPFIKMLQVESGFDVADNEIVQRCTHGDLIITSDIPLAAEVIEKGCFVVTSRGEEYTKENIRSRLNIRDFMETMRSSGVQTGGPPPLGQSERKAFADKLDRIIARS